MSKLAWLQSDLRGIEILKCLGNAVVPQQLQSDLRGIEITF